MYADPAELQLKRQLEQALGRPVSDDEWESFKRVASQTTTQSSPATGRRRGPVARAARSLWDGTTALLGVAGFYIGICMVGAAWLAVYFGLAWAYRFNTGKTGLSAAFVLGFMTLVLANWRATKIILGLALSGCFVALAIGAILRAAGG